MPNEYDWIPQTANNLANIFGLNPKAAAEGRQMQAQTDLLGEKAITEREHRPLQGKVYVAQANQYDAGANAHNAHAGKFNAERAGIEAINAIRDKIGPATAAWAAASSPEEKQRLATTVAGLMAQYAQPGAAESVRDFTSLDESYRNPRLAGQQGKIAAAFESDASFTPEEAAAIRAEKSKQAQDLQRVKNEGELATALAAAATGPKAPRLATPQEVFDLLGQEDANLPQGAKVVLAQQILDEQRRTGSDLLTAHQAVLTRRNITRSTQDAPGLFTGDASALRIGNKPLTEDAVRPQAAPSTPAAPNSTAPNVPAAAPAAAQGNANLPRVTNDQAGRDVYARLAPGARYVHPDGTIRTKR